LFIFNAQKVKYLVVGGYAVSFHAQPRATRDIDLLIKPDADNGKAVYAALARFFTTPKGGRVLNCHQIGDIHGERNGLFGPARPEGFSECRFCESGSYGLSGTGGDFT
jgi:hypothetical protein